MFKKAIIASAGVLLGAQAAHAADIAPAPSDWTGFYLGVNGGYGGGTFDFPMNIKTNFPVVNDQNLDYNFGADITASGFFGGGQIGYNYQIDNFVLGAEADIVGSNIKGKLDIYSKTADSNVSGEAQVDWFATGRLRAGYAATSNLLIYATGGIAWGSVNSGYDLDLGSIGRIKDDTNTSHVGWTLGGGFEYAVTEHISLKTEYLYVDLGEENLLNQNFADLIGNAPPGTEANLKIKQDIAIQTIKAGINYRF